MGMGKQPTPFKTLVNMTKKITFNEYCQYVLNIYTPGLPDESQCSGYLRLKEMVKNQEQPYFNELEIGQPHNLHAFHVNLRSHLISCWDKIKILEL